MAKQENDIEPTVCANIDKFAVVNSNGHCVLKNDCANDQEDTVQSSYNIENSNDVVIGPVTHFHCPVTIIQRTASNEILEKPALTKIETDENSPDKLKNENKLENFKYFKPRRKMICVIALTTVILVAIVATGLSLLLAHDSSKLPANNNKEEVINLGSSQSQIFPRWFWGARPPLYIRKLNVPVDYVVIAHTATLKCETFEECAGTLQTLQTYAVEHNSPDIGYNFLMGSDGNVYVGRGWDAINYLVNHTISIAFIGNFTYDEFTKKMQEALKELIQLGVDLGKISANYTLLSHSQTGQTLSPGTNIRNVIKTWPHYYPLEYIDIPD